MDKSLARFSECCFQGRSTPAMHHDPRGDDRVWHEDLVLSSLISCIDRSKVASSLGPYRSAYKVAGPRNLTLYLLWCIRRGYMCRKLFVMAHHGALSWLRFLKTSEFAEKQCTPVDTLKARRKPWPRCAVYKIRRR